MNRTAFQSRLFARLSLVCGLVAAGLALSSVGASATPSEGVLDPLFGTNGTLSLDASGAPSDDDPVDLDIGPDGSHYVLASSMVGGTVFRVVKVTAAGSIVTSFGTNGQAVVDTSIMNASHKKIEVLSDGKIVVSLADNSNVDIIRFDANGAPDTTFDSDGKTVATVPPMSTNINVSPSTNGTSWICFRTSAGMYTVRRVTTNGAIDTTIGNSGDVDVWSSGGTASCLADATGRLWVMTDDGMNGMKFGRLSVAGALDQTIGTQGVFTSPSILMNWAPYGGFVDADGVSFYGFQSGPTALGIVRITNAGQLTSVTAPLGSVWSGQPTLVTHIQPVNGDFLVAAGFQNNSVSVVKALANSTFDSSFGNQGEISFSAGMFPVGRFRADGSLAFIYKSMGMPADVPLKSTDTALAIDSAFGVSGTRVIDLKLGYFVWQPKAILQDSSLLVFQNNGGFRFMRMNSQGELLSGSTPEGILGAENVLQGVDGKIWSVGYDFMAQKLTVYRFGTDLTYDQAFNGGAPLQIPMGTFPSFLPLFEVGGELVVSNIVTTLGNPSIVMRTISPTGTASSDTTHSLGCCTAMNASWGFGPRAQIAHDGALYINYSEGQYSPHIVKISTSGLDTNFGTGGKVALAPAGYSELQQLGIIIDASGITAMVKGKDAQNAYKYLVLRYSLAGVLDTNFGTGGTLELANAFAMSFADFYPRTNGGFVKYELTNTGSDWVGTFVYHTSTGAVDTAVANAGSVTFSYPTANMGPPPQLAIDGRGGALLWRTGSTQTIARVMIGGESVTLIAAPPTTTSTTTVPSNTPAPNNVVVAPMPVVPVTTPSPTTTVVPIASVVAPPEAVILALPSAADPIAPTVGAVMAVGQQITATFAGFVPGEVVQLIVASTPRVIGSSVADSNGSVTIVGVIPSDLAPGAHTLAVYAPDSGYGVRQSIVVTAPLLPVTGAGPTNTVALVFALFSLVFGVLLIRSRRTLIP